MYSEFTSARITARSTPATISSGKCVAISASVRNTCSTRVRNARHKKQSGERAAIVRALSVCCGLPHRAAHGLVGGAQQRPMHHVVEREQRHEAHQGSHQHARHLPCYTLKSLML